MPIYFFKNIFQFANAKQNSFLMSISFLSKGFLLGLLLFTSHSMQGHKPFANEVDHALEIVNESYLVDSTAKNLHAKLEIEDLTGMLEIH